MASLKDRPTASSRCASFYVRNVGPVPLIDVSGELDLSNANTFAACLSVFEPGDEVIIDLSALTFIDSTGIAILAETCRRGVRLTARGARGAVRKVLDICGMDCVMVIDGDAPEVG